MSSRIYKDQASKAVLYSEPVKSTSHFNHVTTAARHAAGLLEGIVYNPLVCLSHHQSPLWMTLHGYRIALVATQQRQRFYFLASRCCWIPHCYKPAFKFGSNAATMQLPLYISWLGL
eukprot:scaffold318804_cov20-Prasinocladus_malaysianus.AAC.1